MKVKVTVFRERGKYYTVETIEIPMIDDFWGMRTYIETTIIEKRIPGLMPGASDYHVVAVEIKEDGSEGVPHLFPLTSASGTEG